MSASLALSEATDHLSGPSAATASEVSHRLRCPLLAQSRHHAAEFQCPLSGVKRTLAEDAAMSAFDPKRTLASGPFRPNSVNCIRFDAINSVFMQPTDIVGLYSRCRFRTHLLDGPTQSSTKCDGPPVIS